MKHIVKAQFIFTGEFTVEADTKEEANDLVRNHCHLCIGGDIHTDPLPNAIDWNFDQHAQTVVEDE